MNGKGSKPRPFGKYDKYLNNFDLIDWSITGNKNKKREKKKKKEPEDN